MSHYQLYVVDKNGNTSTWSHTNGHRGKPCIVFSDDVDSMIILDHPTMRTHLYISASGVLDITVEEKPLAEPEPTKYVHKRLRRKQRRK